MYVPAHLQEIAAALALRSWVDSKKFPRDTYFETIDGAKVLLAPHSGGAGEPREEAIVLVLVGSLDEEGLLLTYVLQRNTYLLNIEDHEMRWFRACQACAWVVLQAYERECKAGKWPK